MTSHWCDIENADVIMSIGSNSVESHPLSSRYIERAQRKGGTWIVVDPRYTRSAAQADLFACIRPGTDIAFYGGLINYIIYNDLWQDEYVQNYTNARYLIDPDFEFDPETGLFSGCDDETGTYSAAWWPTRSPRTSSGTLRGRRRRLGSRRRRARVHPARQ